MIKDLLKEKLSESVMAHLKRYVFCEVIEVLGEGDLEVTPGHFKGSFSRTIRCEMILC